MQRCILAILTLAACAGAQAASESVDINLVTSQSVGQAIGSVKISETAKGLEFTPDLKALPPGEHGFHIHANGSCQPAIKEGKAVAAGAAGGHYDPQKTGKHEGPDGAGHLGDLPFLVVNNDGSHAAISATGMIALSKGCHSYKLLYFEDYEGEFFSWNWKLPSSKEFGPIPTSALFVK